MKTKGGTAQPSLLALLLSMVPGAGFVPFMIAVSNVQTFDKDSVWHEEGIMQITLFGVSHTIYLAALALHTL